MPIELPWKLFYEKEIDVRFSRSYGPGRYDPAYEWGGQDYPIGYVRWTEQRNFQACLHLMAGGKINLEALTTLRAPFDKALEVYPQLLKKSLQHVGVVLEYPLAPIEQQPEPTAIIPQEPKTIPSRHLSKPIQLVDVIGAGNFARTMLLPHLKGEIGFGTVANQTALSANHVKTKFAFEEATTNSKEVLVSHPDRALLIATRHHLHGPLVKAGLEHDRHIFVEKPLCQTPEQGVELMDAARASKSIVQVGMQRRSYDLYLKARDICVAGSLGAVRLVRSWWINNSLRTASTAALKGPLDWEQWQGPAKRHALEPDRFFNWRAYKDYAGGIVADQGAHIYDGIHLIRGVGFPSAVNASGGRVHSNADTPETVVVAAEYPDDFLGIFTINYAGMRYPTRLDQLNQFDGDQARMDVGREFLAVYPQAQPEKASITAEGSFNSAAEMHVRNFLDCVRSRKEPNGTVEKGFQAALVVQLANRSLDLGRKVKWDAIKRKVE